MPKLFQSVNIAPHKVRNAVAKMETKSNLQHVLETCPDCRAIAKYGVNSEALCVYAKRSAFEILGWLEGHRQYHLRKDNVVLPAEYTARDLKRLSKIELIGKDKLVKAMAGAYDWDGEGPEPENMSQLRSRTGDSLRWYSEMSKEKLLTKFSAKDFQKLAGEMLMIMGPAVEKELKA